MTTAEHTAEKQKSAVARLAGVDFARGLAVFGMFAAHVGPDPSVGGVVGHVMQLAHGRASALFAMLAGLSLAIMSGRQQPAIGTAGRQAVVKIAIRAVAYYGVFFLMALPFTRLRAKPLAIVAAATAIAGPILSFVVRKWLAGSGWDQLIASNDPIRMIGGDGILQLLFTGGYPAATWMPFVFAGMALGRLDLTAVATRLRLAIVGPLLALAGYGGSRCASSAAGTPRPATCRRSWGSSVTCLR